ncbi:MAG: EF-P lysine aminoacylase GenX [Wenzhouxiangella sp.]|nr:MAG: EF-P lysine aminoacylase GenX [Wenzhouxiangella sp.]
MSEWQPAAGPESLRLRALCLAMIRRFFSDRSVTEVQTPLLTPAGVTDPHIESLQVTGQPGYLRTSPEYFHKRLLAAGFGDLYELGPVFRGGERGRHHRMEFQLLEWYRLGWHWRELAEEVCALIAACAAAIETGPFQVNWLSWRDGFARLGLEPLDDDLCKLEALVPELVGESDRDTLLDYLFSRDIQRHFAPQSITIVHGYPASQAALARLDPEHPGYAQRFEIFLGPVELANGYQELSCADEQHRRFQADNQRRHRLGLPAMPLDEALLEALQAGLPDCAGVALGVDRLLMCLLGHHAIDEVCTF